MRNRVAVPTSAQELHHLLLAMFPALAGKYRGPIHDEEPTYHSVLLALTPILGEELRRASGRELDSFAETICKSQFESPDLYNAFDTCLLEHLHQIGAGPGLRKAIARKRRSTQA